MADPFLIVVILIVTLILLVVNLYILVYFQHPDDKNTAYFPKILVVLGLAFAEAAILLLPLDVSNKAGSVACTNGWGSASFCGGLDMQAMWETISMAIVVIVVVLIPYAIFMYESDDGFGNKTQKVWWEALKMELGMLAIVGMIVGLMFHYLSTASIPAKEYTTQASSLPTYTGGGDITAGDVASALANTGDVTGPADVSIDLQVSFATYMMAMIGFIGWWLFVVFGGIGMAALPIDLVRGFLYRPRKIPGRVYADEKTHLTHTCKELIEIGEALKFDQEAFEAQKHSRWERRKQRNADRTTMNKFKQMVYMLERKHTELKAAKEESSKSNPLMPFVKLAIGVLCGLITLLWDLHIILYLMLDPAADIFLNKYLIWFEDQLNFPLFGALSVGIFSMYLLAAVAKGCFKFGLRFFCFALHPMEVGATYMNSFMFNLGMILFCTIPTVQFSTAAFADYVRLADVSNIFGAQVKNLKFFEWFYRNNVFVYMLFGVHVVALLYLLKFPEDRSASPKEFQELLENARQQRAKGINPEAEELKTLRPRANGKGKGAGGARGVI